MSVKQLRPLPTQFIAYRQQFIPIMPLIGNRVVHDTEGNLYIRWWKKDNLPELAKDRKIYKWTGKDISYRKYSAGIASLERGLSHALRSGSEFHLLYEEIKEIVDSGHAKLVKQSANLALRRSIKTSLMKAKTVVSGGKAPELKEADRLIERIVIFRDSKGRVNVGKVMLEIGALSGRLQERLDNIHNWMVDYRDLRRVLAEYKREFYTFLNRFKLSLKRDRAFINQSRQPKWKIRYFLDKKIKIYSQHLQRWFLIKPFGRWALHCHDDLDALKTRLSFGLTDDAIAIYNKLENAVALKEIQKRLDNLILYLGEKELRPKRTGHYCYEVKDHQRLLRDYDWLVKNIHSLNEEKFTSPVKHRIQKEIYELVTELNQKGCDLRRNIFKVGDEHLEIRNALKKISELI